MSKSQSYKQTKENFFNDRIEERKSAGESFSYSRINQDWNNSSERVNKLFENVPTKHPTNYESNFNDYDDVG
jgi:hypothetical protein